ncbi:unnamed protein product, partial [Rotaria sp. Silwood2]
STVIRWLKRWDQTKDLSDHSKSGKPRATSTEVGNAITDMRAVQIQIQVVSATSYNL